MGPPAARRTAAPPAAASAASRAAARAGGAAQRPDAGRQVAKVARVAPLPRGVEKARAVLALAGERQQVEALREALGVRRVRQLRPDAVAAGAPAPPRRARRRSRAAGRRGRTRAAPGRRPGGRSSRAARRAGDSRAPGGSRSGSRGARGARAPRDGARRSRAKASRTARDLRRAGLAAARRQPVACEQLGLVGEQGVVETAAEGLDVAGPRPAAGAARGRRPPRRGRAARRAGRPARRRAAAGRPGPRAARSPPPRRRRGARARAGPPPRAARGSARGRLRGHARRPAGRVLGRIDACDQRRGRACLRGELARSAAGRAGPRSSRCAPTPRPRFSRTTRSQRCLQGCVGGGGAFHRSAEEEMTGCGGAQQPGEIADQAGDQGVAHVADARRPRSRG